MIKNHKTKQNINREVNGNVNAAQTKNVVRELLHAAEQGDANAQYNLGWMYDTGEGVPKDSAEAVKWYRLAADQGHAKAQHNLGMMYADGEGVPKDYAEAVKWYRKAADQGDASAQNNLGFMYYFGDGVRKNYTEAEKWYRKAAGQGDAYAQSNLGLMYENGEGVPQDLVQAHVWFNIAGAAGNEDAKKNLAIAEKGMPPEQKAEATKLAHELFAKLPNQNLLADELGLPQDNSYEELHPSALRARSYGVGRVRGVSRRDAEKSRKG